jgi:hypothetical protein
MQESEVSNVIQQSDIVSYGTMAEIQNFQRQRVADFKSSMQIYLGGQIEFYKEVSVPYLGGQIEFYKEVSVPYLGGQIEFYKELSVPTLFKTSI